MLPSTFELEKGLCFVYSGKLAFICTKTIYSKLSILVLTGKSSCYTCWGLCVNVSCAHTSLKYTYETVPNNYICSKFYHWWFHGREEARSRRLVLLASESSPRKHTPWHSLPFCQPLHMCDIHGAPTWKMIIFWSSVSFPRLVRFICWQR